MIYFIELNQFYLKYLAVSKRFLSLQKKIIVETEGILNSDITTAMSEFNVFLPYFNKHLSTKNEEIMAYMSQEGYDKLVAQLHELQTVERPKASAAVGEAADKGDLSENSEYDAAKEAQAHLEAKINQMKMEVAEAKIVDTSKLKTDVVQILSTVEMTNLTNNRKMKYTLVSESEANLREGKISIKTPIAKGLLNKKVGDVAEIKIPRGTIHLRIDKISIG
jgi:transcription elongation factor GreA